ncbi:MAG: hypothetical protein FOGNACKC_00856 [Anaerolineae bacterium]|nr:hypothetical protein [Anaerolineae bacterium]
MTVSGGVINARVCPAWVDPLIESVQTLSFQVVTSPVALTGEFQILYGPGQAQAAQAALALAIELAGAAALNENEKLAPI